MSVTVTGYETTDPDAAVARRRRDRRHGAGDVGADGRDRDGRLLADGDVAEVGLHDVGRDPEGGAVDDDRRAGGGIEAGRDVDLGHEAVDGRDDLRRLDLRLQVGHLLPRVCDLVLGVELVHPGLPDLVGVAAVVGIAPGGIGRPEAYAGGLEAVASRRQLPLEVGRVGRGQDLALLDRVADRHVHLGDRVRRRDLGGAGGVGHEVGVGTEHESVALRRLDGAGRGDVVRDVTDGGGGGEVLGRCRGVGGQAAHRHPHGAKPHGAQHDHGRKLRLHQAPLGQRLAGGARRLAAGADRRRRG